MTKHFFLLAFLLSGCTGTSQNIRPENFDPKSIGSMEFTIREISGTETEDFGQTELVKISDEISRRFSEAGYPVKSTQSVDTRDKADPKQSENTGDTHILEVMVGAPKLTATPPGVSLSLGNSNPRSTNFQKALTVPITCTISSLQSAEQSITLQELKSTPMGIDNLGLDESEIAAKTKRFYIENIGSTCHNLLTKLDVYPSNWEVSGTTDASSTSEQVWGGVRIKIEDDETTTPSHHLPKSIERADHKLETKQDAVMPNIPATPDTSVTSAPPEPAKEAVPAAEKAKIKISQEEINTGSLKTNPENPEQSADPTSTLKTEENQTSDWRKKKITIFNQGDTVILKFGNERR